MRDNYFQYYFKTPGLYPAVIKILFNKVFNRLFKTVFKRESTLFSNKDFNTPERKEIASTAKKIYLKSIPISAFECLPSLDLVINEENCDLNIISILLATKQVNITDSFFNMRFEDQEDYFAANRFIWLYDVLLKYPYKKAIDYCYEKIFQWLNENPLNSADKKFESYSISERIIAFLFFIQFTKPHYRISNSNAEKLLISIMEQINHLISHLEYHGDKTNNHILNNARALYIAGRLLKISEIEQLAKKILENEISIAFDNGCYIEGSSHYQMLLTKNFLEMTMIAEQTDDREFKSLFKKRVSQMIIQCDILQSKYLPSQYPLFGDISPDMSPDWFIGKPFSINGNKDSKWFSLFKYKLQDSTFEISDSQNISKESMKTQWLYLERNGFEVWSTIRSGVIPGHGHNDNGSVVVFYKGTPIIIDPGLSTYLHGKKKEQQVSYLAHNTPVVDSFPPDAPKNSMMSSSPVASRVFGIKIRWGIMEYNLQFAKKNLGIIRQIIVNNSTCMIIDKSENTDGVEKYETSWIFTERPVQLAKNTFSIKKFKIEFFCDHEIQFQIEESNNRSTKYGELTSSYNLMLRSMMPNSEIKMILTKNDLY